MEKFELRVIGQLTMGGKVSLIAEESLLDIQKGSLVHSVTKSTYNKMRTPKTVRIFVDTFGKKRIESVISAS